MPKIFTSEKQKIGKLGEDIACKFLVKQDYLILEQNYTKKWGEIDIVAEKDNKIHFIEVKSVSCKTLNRVSNLPAQIGSRDSYKPTDNIHPWKLKRLGRVIQTYLLDRKVPEQKFWQFDVCSVFLDMERRVAKVSVMEDVIL